MALDSSFIAQGVRPPQLDNPIQNMEAIAQVNRLRQEAALGPLRQQQLQGEVQQTQLHNQVTQAALDRQAHDEADEQTANKVLVDNGGDWDKARSQLAGKINTRVLQKKDADHLEYVRGWAATDAEKRKNAIEKSDFIGREINGVLQLPEEQRQPAWDAALQRAVEAGAIKADHPDVPQQVPSGDVLKGLLARTTYAGQAAKIADQQAQEDQRREIAAKNKAAALRQATLDLHNEAATAFQGISDKASYDKAVKDFADQDEEHAAYAKRFLDPLPFSDKSVDIINRRALKPETRATADSRAAAHPMEVALKWARAQFPDADDNVVYDAALKRYSETTKEGKFAPETPGGRVEKQKQKEWMSQFDKSTREEQDLYRMLQRYGDAIDSGGTFLQETANGKLTAQPMDKYTGSDEEKKKHAIEDMKQRADIVRERIKTAIQRKYDLGSRLGAEPTVPLDEAIGGIDAGRYNKGKQQATGPTAAAPGAAPGAPPAQPAPAPAKPVQSGQNPSTVIGAKLRDDIPPGVSTNIAEGQTRTVNSPNGPMKLMKANGKIYQVP